jgi:hypothetical protein
MSYKPNAHWLAEQGVVFHVTPISNLDSILKLGIAPEYSRGKRLACYYVTPDSLLWAVAHVSYSHDVPVSRLAVIRLRFHKLMKSSGTMGVYYCRATMLVTSNIVLDIDEVLTAFVEPDEGNKHGHFYDPLE